MAIEAGSKVVCVDGKFDEWVKKLYTELPVEGVVYVVRDVLIGVAHGEGAEPRGTVRLLLIGVNNPIPEKGTSASHERGFKIERFRELEELQSRAREQRHDASPKTEPAKLEPACA